jgi:hypothetical protein
MNNYIKRCIEFLGKTGYARLLPERDHLELKEDGTSQISMCFFEYISMGQIPIPDILSTSIYFMVFDSYLESKNPNLEGESFRQKYLDLPKGNNMERIVASIYRILKVYRNATVHQMHSILHTASDIRIDYLFSKTNFKLEISNQGIKTLQEFILCFFQYCESIYSDSYLELLFNGFYLDILKEIKDFNDEDGNILLSFPGLINRYQRSDCKIKNYSIHNNELDFHFPDKFYDSTKYSIDIFFEYNNREYIVPNEVLNGKKLTIEKINLWEKK